MTQSRILDVRKKILGKNQQFAEWIDAAGYCPQCQSDRTITNLQSFRCPVCRTPIAQIVGGNEMEMLTMEVQSQEVPASL